MQRGTEYVVLQYRLNLRAISQAEQTVNQVICGVKDTAKNVRKYSLLQWRTRSSIRNVENHQI